ncbi:hypothetical protein BY996DRAFT_6413486 [Phakopsora pachyrhizi]|nr:hypothetical protein BY996DRAFT_6413486 [Phakopsora pachyrhizi]
MRSLIIPTLLCVLFIHKSCATIHTQCYNYFLNKDGCVYATADNRTRCPLNPKPQTAVKVPDRNVSQFCNSNHFNDSLLLFWVKEVAQQFCEWQRNPTAIKDCHDFKTTEPEVGCFQIALTQKTFLRLKPSKEEIAKGSIKFLKWDLILTELVVKWNEQFTIIIRTKVFVKWYTTP